MKKLIILFLVISTLTSCGEYQRVLNRGEATEQYKLGVKLYEAQNYKKAIRLLEKIVPAFRGKPQMERIQFMIANSNLNENNYSLSGYYFNRFVTNFPKSSKREEADFLSAYSYYKSTPKYSVDKKGIDKAIASFQKFISDYPESDKSEEANKYYKELIYQLEKKQFEIAKGYYKTAGFNSRNYRASITAFDVLLEDHLGTTFKEEALYYSFRASHDLALKSIAKKKEERIESAEKAYKRFKRSFPESKFMKELDKKLANLQEEKEDFKKIKNQLRLTKS